MRHLLLAVGLLAFSGCSVYTFKVLHDPQKRIGEYTCEKNAYYLLIGKVDEARAKYLKSSIRMGIDNEYKAFKQAQKEVLEKADKNDDRNITTEEAYEMHMAGAARRPKAKTVRAPKKKSKPVAKAVTGGK